MSVEIGPSECPSCGHVNTVFIRSEDELLCRGCSSEVVQDLPVGSYHPRHSLPPDTFSPVSAGIDDGPAVTGIPNPVLRPGRRHYRKIP